MQHQGKAFRLAPDCRILIRAALSYSSSKISVKGIFSEQQFFLYIRKLDNFPTNGSYVTHSSPMLGEQRCQKNSNAYPADYFASANGEQRRNSIDR
jgi:hypothetical protein